MSLRIIKCSNEKGKKSSTLSFFRCWRTGSSHFFYQTYKRKIPHFKSCSRLWKFCSLRSADLSPELSVQILSQHASAQKVPWLLLPSHLIPSVFPRISLPDIYILFSKTPDIAFHPDSVISISSDRAHCGNVPLSLGRWVSVLRSLVNCLSLSFRFNDHFNFSLNNIFWIVIIILFPFSAISSFKKCSNL